MTHATSSADAAIVLYDADCGWCRWSLAKLLRWDRSFRLATLAIQDPAADAILASIAPNERLSSWHILARDGRLHSAGAALSPLLKLLPGGALLAVIPATLPGLTRRVYGWVAGHRRLLARPLSRGAITRADKIVEQRAYRSPPEGHHEPLRVS